jgi:hypothetical protein
VMRTGFCERADERALNYAFRCTAFIVVPAKAGTHTPRPLD